MKKIMILLSLLILSFGANAKVYDFKNLYKTLGYSKDSNYFNATPDELMSIESYIDKYDSFYTEINNYLRYYPAPYEYNGSGPEDSKEMVKNIDRVIGRAPKIPSDIILFRGLTLKWHQNKAFEIGEEYFDKAYISTSTSYSVADYFAKGLSDEKRINEKKAIFALYFEQKIVKGLLIDQGEDEVILPHGQRFKIMQKKTMKEYDYYLVQVCEKICKESIEKKDVLEWWAN